MSLENYLSVIPESLKTFLSVLFNSKKKKKQVASIGQAIMQAARPNSLVMPLQLGLGLQLHKHFM